MNLIQAIFPIKLQLNILQLEGYDILRFYTWIFNHFFRRKIEGKRKLVITLKIKQILIISLLLNLLILLIISTISRSIGIGLVTFFVILSQPYLLFPFALLLIKPYELINRDFVIEKNRSLTLSSKRLKIIGVTGSFAKSSVKEILYQLLKDKYQTLRTPESYNTIFGIDKFLRYEFDKNYEILICEMAAYKKGEIKELCHMVPPQYGIITGITSQHLERFGSLENIVSAKFELLEAVPNKNCIIFNYDNKKILTELTKRKIDTKPKISIKGIKLDRNGSNFTMSITGKKYVVHTTLFGVSQIKNIVMASEMALKLGLKPVEIISKISILMPFSSRTVLRLLGTSTIVDNTFSSNIESFNETIESARKVSGKKVLVTPGIVELGKDQVGTHTELGTKLKNVFNEVILVGKNPRTESLAKGLGDASKVAYIDDSRQTYSQKIAQLAKKYDWIFLENDLTQNY